MAQILKHHVLIIAVGSVVLFTNLGGTRLWDRDEPRNAGCAAEMMARGDWVVPVFNGELRTAKPVLLYWFIMSAYSLFGVNEFAARFWSALLGLGTVLATYYLGRRLFNARVAVWAAMLLIASLMFNVSSRASTPDSPLIFFSTLGILVYVYTGFPGLSRSWWAYVLMYAMFGMGVLAKGPVGVVVPMAVIGMHLLIKRLPDREVVDAGRAQSVQRGAWSWRRLVEFSAPLFRPFAPVHFLRTVWAMRPLTAIGSVGLVALPWYVWVAVRTDGLWIERFLWVENFGRATAPMENHRGTPLYYLVVILAGFFPASLLIWPAFQNAVAQLRRQGKTYDAYLLLCCWVGVYLGIFSLAQTKLPNYITPCYPALALLSACFVQNWLSGDFSWSLTRIRVGQVIYGLVGVLLSIGLLVVAREYLPGENVVWLIGAVPLLGAVACLVLLHYERRRAMIATFVATGILFCWSLFGLVTSQVAKYQQNHLLFEKVVSDRPQSRLASYRCLEPSWVFYSGHTIRPFGGDSVATASFLNASSDHYVITTEHHFQDLQLRVNECVGVLEEVPYFLKKHRLVLLGHVRPSHLTAGLENHKDRN
jgi:4-amino-4-deoxy-L-arabinose transferase-like glycosyltransferase